MEEPAMMTPAEVDMNTREMQRDYRNEATMEAQARSLAPGLFDRLMAALRPRTTPQPTRVRPAMPVAAPTTSR
jgi:hypothetical protein